MTRSTSLHLEQARAHLLRVATELAFRDFTYFRGEAQGISQRDLIQLRAAVAGVRSLIELQTIQGETP